MEQFAHWSPSTLTTKSNAINSDHCYIYGAGGIKALTKKIFKFPETTDMVHPDFPVDRLVIRIDACWRINLPFRVSYSTLIGHVENFLALLNFVSTGWLQKCLQWRCTPAALWLYKAIYQLDAVEGALLPFFLNNWKMHVCFFFGHLDRVQSVIAGWHQKALVHVDKTNLDFYLFTFWPDFTKQLLFAFSPRYFYAPPLKWKV